MADLTPSTNQVSASTEGYAVRVLGPVAIRAVSRDAAQSPARGPAQETANPSKGSRQLLSLLVAGGPSGVSAHRLAENIWPRRQPSRWRNTLSRAVSRLRRHGLPIRLDDARYLLDVPVAAVDAWHLEEVVEAETLESPIVSQLLSTARAFGDVSLTVDLDVESERLRGQQHRLLARAADEGLELAIPTVSRLADHLASDPFDPGLLDHVVTLQRRAGGRSLARQTLSLAATLRGPGNYEDIDRLVGELDSDPADDLGNFDETPVDETSRPPDLPERLVRHRPASLTGREALLDQAERALDADDPAVVWFSGPAGVGKTSLLAELAARRGRRSMVVDLVGVSADTAPLSVLSTAFPEVGAGGAAGLLEVLIGRARGRAVLLIVDDAQWIDAQTCSVLHSLLLADRSDLRIDGLVVASRDDDTGRAGPSRQLISAAARVTTPVSLEVGPLTVDELASLVGVVEQTVPLRHRHQRAVWLHQVSGGIPEVALRLIDAGSGETSPQRQIVGAAGENPPYEGLYHDLISRLDAPSQLVGRAAAVLGRRFRLSDVSELLSTDVDPLIRPDADGTAFGRAKNEGLGLDDDRLFDLVDDLVSSNVLQETGSLDEYEFSHDLLVDAFLIDVKSERLAHLHLRAAEMADDVHTLARHRLGALLLLDPDVVVETVLASASGHLADREFWACVVAFQQAISIVGVAGLPLEAQVDYASALALVGSDQEAEAARGRAHATAVAQGRWEEAVAAACAGLPEAETADGEQDRVDLLLQVPPTELSRAARFDQAVTIARQATRIGDQALADAWSAKAEKAARRPEERLLASLAVRWATRSTVRSDERRARLRAVVDELRADPDGWAAVPAHDRATAALYAGFDALEVYDLAGAQTAVAEAASIATDDLNVQWRIKVFGALLLEVQGNVEAADVAADEAQRFGQRNGVAVAEVARLALAFNRRDSFGQLAELAVLLNAVPEPDASVLYLSSLVRLAEVSGQVGQAIEMAEDLAARALERPLLHFQALPVLASALARSDRLDLRRRAAEVLEPYRGSAMVAGMGVGIRPSVSASLLLLEGGFERSIVPATEQAIADADRGGFLPWSIRHRLELADLTGDQAARDEAIELARPTELWPVVAPQVGLNLG